VTDLHDDINFAYYEDTDKPMFVGASGSTNYYAIAIAWRWEARQFIPMMAK
jgi:hypothetical protein